ncbi:hypothetical protein Taro_023808 [Colocasia esculenta]|uniref:TF-B3 domain-containing protein n=1 Tax=Colocasia esculenta TaxID=4460 RepID=A0A843V4R0_COLES|nr:hypothetical protein [Colocasia esculenta]
MGGSDRHWACAECARKCSKVHGRRSPPSQISFFKIMLGQFKESLIVPPKFARLLRGLVGQKFYLENADGNRWEIKLLKIDNCLAFQEGWNEFVSYHSIQLGEIVIFKYINPCSFCVQIFGVSGCERSHFCDNTDGVTRKRCSIGCSSFHKDGGKNEICKFGSCIQNKVSSKKMKPIRNTPSEYFPSTHLHCKTDGDFQKRKTSATECFGLHKDGRTTDRDSAKKRKAMVAIPCETLSTSRSAEGALEEFNMQQISSSLIMAENSKFQTATTSGYSEVACIVVSEDKRKGPEESQMGLLDTCGDVNVRPVNNASENREKGRQMAPTDMSANVDVNQVDHPELPCKLSKTDSQKDEEMIAILPSELTSIGVTTENTDKSVITEEKSFYSTTSKLSQVSCGEKCQGNKNEPPATEGVVNITSSLTEMGISLTNCLDIAPISSEMSLNKGVGFKSLAIELPISGLSDEKIMSEEEKSAAAKDDILDKASTAKNFISSQNFPSLKCFGDIGENLSAYDAATCRILVDELGTCYIVQNSISNPVSNSTSADIFNNDIADAKCNNALALIVKEVSFQSVIVSKDLCSAPVFGSRGVESPKRTVMTSTTDNGYPTQNCHLDSMGGNALAISEENDAFSVQDVAEQSSRIPKGQEASDTMNRSSDGVKQDSASQENKRLPCPGEPDLKAVKAEIMDPDGLSSSCSSFSLVVKTLSWHELSESLPPSRGRFRHERKVMLLRDPAMRVWPVLYQESLMFTGFLGGWEAFVAANSVREGDTCYFEIACHTEPLLQVRISRAQISN